MTQKHDIIIIGGSLSGLTAAVAFADIGLKVALIESRNFVEIIKANSDGRSSAISLGSFLFFTKLGIAEPLIKHSGAILDIRVSDGNSNCYLHFDHSLVSNQPMGYMIPNHILLKTLHDKAQSNNNITLIENCSYIDATTDNYQTEVNLSNNKTLTASLLIAADGKYSKLRDAFGIKTNGWSYNETGIVCNVKHELPHNGVAQERFLPTGPFAALPLKDPHTSSLVWVEETELANSYLAMDDTEFLENIQKRFNGYLGSKLELASPRFSYPLALVHAKKYTKTRFALIGDAAHGVHPLAGQGFNLGIRDIEQLTKLLAAQINLGLDIGANTVLSEYEKIRKFDSYTIIAITDGFDRIFAFKNPAIKAIRRGALAIINKSNPAKKLFMKQAMGIHKLEL